MVIRRVFGVSGREIGFVSQHNHSWLSIGDLGRFRAAASRECDHGFPSLPDPSGASPIVGKGS
jgi:hypothetical protein